MFEIILAGITCSCCTYIITNENNNILLCQNCIIQEPNRIKRYKHSVKYIHILLKK